MSNLSESSRVGQEEVAFTPEELFFSRTNDRGILQFGNDVFTRISGYEWGRELKGAPHKIVRHPDMPRAVFWLLWTSIQDGTPIGAYVKNRAKNGQPYWVFAIVTPISNGYLSVRLKPLSQIKPAIVQAYSEVRAQELDEKLEPSDSAALLMEKIKALGYPDYRTFMAQALAGEVAARNAELGREDTQALIGYRNMLDALDRIQRFSRAIVTDFENIKTSPVNMGVVAAQLGQQALPLSVISQSFTDMIGEIRSGISAFVTRADKVASEIHHGLFVTCANLVQKEVIDDFEAGDDPELIQAERGFLSELEGRYLQTGLQHMVDEITQFHGTCKRLTRTLSGLSVTSIIGQIESARIGQQGAGIDDIMHQLDGFQAKTRDELERIQDDSHVLLDALQRELASAGEVPAAHHVRRSA